MKATALVTVILSAAWGAGSSAGQESPARRDAAQVVRQLLDHDTVVQMPVKGRAERSIEKDVVVAMPQGRSRVILVRLPDASAPYDLIARTPHSGALVFTDTVDLTRVIPEYDFVVRGRGLRKEPRVETTISIAPNSRERFILFYGLDAGARLKLETVPSRK